MKYKNIREEELKNKVGNTWFKVYDTTEILGDIDFTVFPQQKTIFGRVPLLWAEAKTGNYDIPTMFVQLILTIGKARTYDKTIPPAFLGAFDFNKIAFISYISIQDIFYINDFNWNVTPSNHDTKEFKLIKNRIEATLKSNTYVYDFEKDEKELKYFISNNIAKATDSIKLKINKNNFIPIYLRWLEVIKPNIEVKWDELKKINILDSDFYLADLFVDDKDTQDISDDLTMRENLFVVFQNSGYKIAKENINQMWDGRINLRNNEIYKQFWKRYKRPPIKDFQEYIIERRDLLVPQDIRERKGAFFTPFQWVELSQKYIADLLGENWQDEYYIWDCAAGTGNLLNGLTNKYNIWASTLDQADVKVMHERIGHGANLLENHVFKFDFLNDDFSKLPLSLQDIINDVNKRKKLIIYINPPYAEVSSKAETGKVGVNQTRIHDKYSSILGTAGRELFAQFFIRIYTEFNGVILAEFSTLKLLQGSAFIKLKENFQAKLEKIFLAPADTFDNVKGQFPIGFKIWDTNKKEVFDKIIADVYDKNANFIGTKGLYSLNKNQYINKFISFYKVDNENNIGYMDGINGNDFQHNNIVYILNTKEQIPNPRGIWINKYNLIPVCIYFSVRKVIEANWLNDRDQFLNPNEKWKKDKNFQSDCLTFAIFNNYITTKYGVNNWIPFTETEVNAKDKFAKTFIADFIKGKIKFEKDVKVTLFGIEDNIETEWPINFSKEAISVFESGLELWKYYHSKKDIDVNAGLYDIKVYFQGRNKNGRMNAKSSDEVYTTLMTNLRFNLNLLADNIIPKVYEYEFLKV